ncbi:MAG: endonuclease/Exonuclease/phosphatase family protein [Massilia sp.]|nr:endonuclease/Exonuclease/phosphatase family protein [Massilia sp.]
MKTPASISSPGQLTVLAALIAGLAIPAIASASTDIVISQVSSGGGNGTGTTSSPYNPYKNDFIELLNPTNAPVTMSGWSVQYASATGNSWTRTDLPPVTLQPGQYYLIQEAAGANTAAADLPTPDATGTLAMGATAGKVALVRNQTSLTINNPNQATPNVADLVGFGPSATGFEGAAAPAPANPTALLRKGAGCADTDNNSADFDVAAPAPRNRASAAASCNGAPAEPVIVASCPPNLSFAFGIGGSAVLTARDTDSIVNGASITSSAVAGISLSGFTASSEDGAAASVNLNVAASTASGTYPVVVNFVNDDRQNTSCTVSVSVAAPASASRRIFEIQGPGASSPYASSVQTTEGVVTARVATGFFIQDATGDGDPTTSDAIYVYTGNTAPTVSINDVVRVTATVQEYTPTGAAASLTELVNPSAIVKIGTATPIAPTNIALPIDDFGPYQGMLVRFAQPLTASQVEFVGDRGEISLSSGRLETTTNRFKVNTPEELALRAANARNLIVLDDGIFVTPTVIPYIAADKTIRAGDTTSNLTGVIDMGAVGGTPTKSLYKLQPTEPVTFSRDNPRPTAPSFGTGNVKVASANVLNFFTTFTNGASVFSTATNQTCSLGSSNSKSNCRGADNLNEFTRQRDKIVNSLKLIDADVVGLMEIQNNGETAVTYLVDQLNAAYGQTVYAVVPKPQAVGSNNGTGTDAIRVAMIYKPAKLTLAGPSQTDPDPDNINNRPPMAQSFILPANGGKFSLIVNHLKSKGSCPSTGDTDKGEGCWTQVRVQQAARLVTNFIPKVQTDSGIDAALLIGDFNSYGMEAPINLMTDAGIVNQLERYVRPMGMPYSYVFNSTAGYLDHALATPAMSAQISDASEFHNNADEPSVIDYNTDGKPQDLYVNNAYRASDHDPVTVTLNLAAVPAADVSASFTISRSAFTLNRATGQYGAAATLINKSSRGVTGPIHVEITGLPSGVTITNATGMRNGVPYITVPNGYIVPGGTLSVSMQASNPGKVAINYNIIVEAGVF